MANPKSVPYTFIIDAFAVRCFSFEHLKSQGRLEEYRPRERQIQGNLFSSDMPKDTRTNSTLHLHTFRDHMR